MNVDSGALGSYLHHTLLSVGVDAVLPSTQRHGFALYSSSDESGSFSADDRDTSSSSSSNSGSSMSASHGMDCDLSQSSVDSDDSDDTMDKFMISFISKRIAATAQYSPFLFDMPTEVEEFHDAGTSINTEIEELHDEGASISQNRRQRRSNRFEYKFGDYLNSNYFRKFLCPETRDITYEKSREKHSVFRSHFRVPLVTIDYLTEMFISKGWVENTKRCHSDYQLSIRTQLFIMCALEHLGNRRPHRQFETETEMSYTEHRKFFTLFIDRLYSVKDDFVVYPKTMEHLQVNVKDYCEQHLPGAAGSIDVVHVKWSRCPAGDYNKCKGKESFPSVAFECVTNNHRRILAIAPIQYGSRNDKHIVRFDPTVSSLKFDWYKDVEWEYFTLNGESKRSNGLYLLCDGGYLRWQTLICPYAGDEQFGRRAYFNSNLESIRKDVECTFGILKKRWRILDYGLPYYRMKMCEKVFTACCMLHNMLLDVGEEQGIRNVTRVGRGAPVGNDGLWLEGLEKLNRWLMGDTSLSMIRAADHIEAIKWMERKEFFADHLEYCRSINR